LARNAAGFAIREALQTLNRDGNMQAMQARMLNMKEYNTVLDIATIEQWEQDYMGG
jgi:hypothetical protein